MLELPWGWGLVAVSVIYFNPGLVKHLSGLLVWSHQQGKQVREMVHMKKKPKLFTRISGHYYGLIDVRTIDFEHYALGWETPVSGDDLARYKAMVAAA